jgi:hypothetical protein
MSVQRTAKARIPNGTSEATTPVTNGLEKHALNWPTLVLILVTGGGNFLATERESATRQADIERAISQLREIHDSLDDFQKRHDKTLEGIGQGLNGLHEALKAHEEEIQGIHDTLKNQSTMLANQHEILSALQALGK